MRFQEYRRGGGRQFTRRQATTKRGNTYLRATKFSAASLQICHCEKRPGLITTEESFRAISATNLFYKMPPTVSFSLAAMTLRHDCEKCTVKLFTKITDAVVSLITIPRRRRAATKMPKCSKRARSIQDANRELPAVTLIAEQKHYYIGMITGAAICRAPLQHYAKKISQRVTMTQRLRLDMSIIMTLTITMISNTYGFSSHFYHY